MLARSGLVLLFVLATAACFEVGPEEAAPRRARFSANSPNDVAKCLNGAVAVGCGVFACLENSTCDTDGMHDICQLFLHTAATFNTQGKTFVKESLRCIAQGITSKVFQTIRRCNVFQRMIAEVQEECYNSLDICTVARTNPDAIGEVVQVPAHFPNRYYSTLLQSLLACDEQTVAAVRAGLISRLGPDMETFFLLLQNKPCATGPNTATHNNPANWRNMPVFNIQPSFRGRDPTHLFARKRSVDDREREYMGEK
ncbi:stanniocalcin 1, like [Myripristis murdjan]|uniref:Stanniocalcin n=1 Tax=Myripristis murdjan TaxID=586833 RepID=A0A667XUX6_9TELE|nr:stanniocalcin-like [Myripristis murdjan]